VSRAEIFTEDIPPGATVSGARQQAFPARTWTALGDGYGTEIWLDADEAASFLVRTVRVPGADGAKPEMSDDEFARRMTRWARRNPAEYQHEIGRLAMRSAVLASRRLTL
jgi:hypothetical protein